MDARTLVALLVLAACSSKGAGSSSMSPLAPSSSGSSSPAATAAPSASASATATAATDASKPEGRARSFIALLEKGDFEHATASFDETMSASLPSAKLQEMWSQLASALGPFKGCTSATVAKTGAYDVVVVNCAFGDKPLGIKTAWDSKGRAAGFFIVPPETPYAPPPYASADLVKRDIKVGSPPWELPGELVLPKGSGPFPALVLVHGSGPGDRNEAIGQNHPFEDLALGLASKGVAVVRYDKRTKVYGKEVGAAIATFTVKEESIDDAVAAVALLEKTPEIDPKRVFVLGHSLGGELAPRILKADPSIAGMIIAAGSTRPVGDVMIEQLKYIAGIHGNSLPEKKALIEKTEKANTRLKEILNGAKADPSEVVLGAAPAYWLDMKGYDAPALAAKLAKPTLVLQGERDYQVTMVDFANWK
jgi:poly(3-hydroxybutyrate) depolymerase